MIQLAFLKNWTVSFANYDNYLHNAEGAII